MWVDVFDKITVLLFTILLQFEINLNTFIEYVAPIYGRFQ